MPALPASPLQTLQTIAVDLLAYTITSYTVHVECYNILGDGGGGFFYWVETPYTGQGDLGTIFPPVMSNPLYGTGYWKRVTDGEMATPEWFGAQCNGAYDDSIAINACIAWAQTTKENLFPPVSPVGSFTYNELWAGVPRIYLSKNYFIQSKITLLFGTWLTFQGGVIVSFSSTPLSYMLGSQFTGHQNSANGNFYSTCDIRIDGKGFLYGNNNAYVGLFTNLVTRANISGLSIVNCTSKKWADNAISISSFSANLLTVSSLAGIQVDDIVRIYNATTGLYTRGVFVVKAFLGTTVTLDQYVISDPPFDTIHFTGSTLSDTLYLQFMPTAFSINGHQSSLKDCYANNNGLGFAFGNSFFPQNVSPPYSPSTVVLDNDDNLHENLLAENNLVGAAYLTCGATINVKSTFQHSVYENLIVGPGANSVKFKQLYSEISSGFSSLNSESYPLNYISGINIDIDAECPVDATVGWFRAFQVDGVDIKMKLSGGSNTVTRPLSPASPLNYSTDPSLVLLTTNVYSNCNLHLILAGYNNLSNQTILSPPGSPPTYNGLRLSVVNSSYQFPATQCFVEATNDVNGQTINAGQVDSYDQLGFFNFNESQPRVLITPSAANSIRFGDGTDAPDAFLNRFDVGVLGTPQSFRVANVLQLINKENNTWSYWPDIAGSIKTLNAIPTDKEAEGTYINGTKIINLASTSFPVIDLTGANTTEARWTLGGNWTLEVTGQPTSPPTPDGKIMRFRIVQGSPVSPPGYNVKWIGPNSIPSSPHGFFFQSPVYPVPTLQTATGAIDYVEFVFNSTTLNWECITKA